MTSTLDSPTTLDTTIDTMRAAVVTEFGAPLQISDLELPTPGYGEALVKAETSGVCHTDLHAAHGDWPVKPQPPFVPGHEGYGTVVALGTGVRDLQVGDKVGNAWLWLGLRQLRILPHRLGDAVREPAERRLQRQRQLRHLHAGQRRLRPTNPGRRRPAGNSAHPVRRRHRLQGPQGDRHPAGQWVAISGIGGLGHIAVQYARAMGLRVVAIDVDDSKLALATRLGAEVVVNARTSDVVAEVQKATGGVHGVLVTAVTRRRSARPSA